MAKKIILIDGNSLVYRAFFALPTTLATRAGQVTNAVYGFTSMLLKLMREEKPDVVAVAFDSGPSFRKEHYAEYKAHRPETPSELPGQFPLVKDVLEVLKIPVFEMPNYEADDILASLAKRQSARGDQIIVVTGDKDAFQLITDGVKIMTTKKGISDVVIYDRDGVIERYGVPPELVADFLALKGDPSDNIPGVPGIGEKTAAKLIREFGSVEELLERLDEVGSDRLRKSIEENADEARLSKKLAVLEMDLPIEIELEEFELGRWDVDEVREVFLHLEFNTLFERFLGLAPGMKEEARVEEVATMDIALSELLAFVDRLAGADRYSLHFAIEGTSIDRRAVSVTFALPGETAASVLALPDDEKRRRAVFESLAPELGDERPRKIVFDYKEAYLALLNEGIELEGVACDVHLAAWLHTPERSKYLLEELAAFYLKRGLPEEMMGTGRGSRAVALLDLAVVLEETLRDLEMLTLLREVEIPLAGVLARIEREGVGIDITHFERASKEMERQLENTEAEIFSLAGQEFNMNSSQQLGVVLFEKLGLPPEKKTKTGYSTDIRVLTKLIGSHPIIEKVITYRELAKLKSTYVDALPRLINQRTGRLHTTFNQTGTATGRLSSHDPNLQNIPIRTELGVRIREGFTPARAGERFLAADYSQIELRLLAHFSKDALLIKAFEDGEDIHAATAQRIFGAMPEQVTAQMRRIAKMINFGVLYGMSAFGLADRLNISQREAKEYIDRYFGRYPGVKGFIDETIAETRRRGYALTILNRRRPVPELASGDWKLRGLGERLAVNSPLQGSAADLIKLAMIRLDERVRRENLPARMVLQVHDELIFEVPEGEIEGIGRVVREVMETIRRLDVPLVVEVSAGINWKDAK